MKMITIKTKPKTIFGIILAITGVVVILITFVGNHSAVASKSIQPVSCATPELRQSYLTSLGWEFSEETSKEITIPSTFNEVYENYNSIQKEQGFDLEKYKGATATIYTYTLTNYPNNDNIIVDLVVVDDVLVGADLCNPDVDEGFLVALLSYDEYNKG